MKILGLCSIIFGIFQMMSGIGILVMMPVQKLFLEKMPGHDPVIKNFIHYADSLYDVWEIYMPALAILGALFLLSGIWLLKKKKSGIILSKIIAPMIVIWFGLYMYSLSRQVMPHLDSLFMFPEDVPELKTIENVFKNFTVLSGIGTGILFCGYPVTLFIVISRQKALNKLSTIW